MGKVIAIAGNVVLLCFFKYFGSGAMPVAISFYTFSQIMYVADHGEEDGFEVLDYLGYITFFPKVLQGPIADHKGIKDGLDKLPSEISEELSLLFDEMNKKETKEAKLYNALDKLEALIQHNESPLDTWSENEKELNKTYAFDKVVFSEWLTDLRREILDDTLKKLGERTVLYRFEGTMRNINYDR